MKNFIVNIISQTASFRDPTFQNYHKSLILPPPTTIIGLCGAALGMTPLQAQDFFDETEISIGIYGCFKGKCQDTWKYNKGIRDMRLYNAGVDASIIQKEFLIENEFYIAFSSENNSHIEKLKKAFENPVYALTMGNSDSLAKVAKIEVDLSEKMSCEIENVFVKGNVVNQVMETVDNSGDLEFSIYSNDALVFDLPTRFNYENDYGKRSISVVDTFSIIGDKMKLNFKVSGLQFQDKFIPLFKL